VLHARFALEEQQANEMTRRVGALEVSLPRLLEAMPANSGIDTSSLTAAIGRDPALVYQAEGGSVVVRQQPMTVGQPAQANSQPLPQPVEQLAAVPAPDERSFGVALGPAITPEQAAETWRDLNMKLGPLLFGMAPLMVDEANGNKKRIVVGPITQLPEATALCTRLEQISVACMPMPFTGTPLTF
jgi:cell division septation protein DedD